MGTVSVEEEESAREMVRYLRGRGYRRLAMIAGPADTPGGRYRLKGFREELGERFDPDLVETGDYSVASGAHALNELLRKDRDFDAVFAANDLMAAGAISALTQAGLRVPEDVAVAGFDDSGLAETSEPAITTMRQPWEDISEQMVSLLLEVIDGAPPRAVALPTTLVPRQSA